MAPRKAARKATPVGVAKAARVPAFPWPRTETAKAAAADSVEPLRTALKSGTSEEIAAALQAQRVHPDAIAAELIEQALQKVHLDPRVHRDAPWLGHFVMLMRELLADSEPGMTLMQLLEPLHKALSQHGGGRPPKVDPVAVVRTLDRLRQQTWYPAPVQDTATEHRISRQHVRNIDKKRKPG